ncbi:hypothetical protein HCN44_004036 [Aphidius gifuensis]|uniref:LisH domain-containing protein n=1 Tax=Aphidius gifuensis TaxID=684658 RepID=A0A835CT17_APHGI|nr:hypothetical protein HCN44_004036 [Aphidius gifuensis]
MEPILPSELARLVLGYLEQENCQEAAKVFFDTSPDLSEYRKLAKLGKPFGKKIYGLTLNNIVENLVSASMLLQEKLSQISDSGSSDHINILKQSNNLMEQLKFILDEKFQRFYVNISVPTPNTSTQTTSGSPIISSSMRKRKTSVTIEHQVNNIEATTLNQLPGHSKNLHDSPQKQEVNKQQQQQQQVEFEVPQIIEQPKEITVNDNPTNQVIPTTLPACAIDTQSATCSTGTDTEELRQFTTTEVQTNPIDNSNHDERIKNLSLLSNALLSRTEIHERIAENINNENRDLSNHEVSDCNASMTAQLNAYIESIVSKTERDPIFENFISGIIRPETDDTEPETEMSPDEEDPIDVINLQDNKSTSPLIFHEQQDIELPLDNPVTNELDKEKNNLPINNDNCYKNNEEIKSLDDMNAAAIMGIMSVNALNEKIIEENKPLNIEEEKVEEKIKARLSKRELKPPVKMDVGVMEVPMLIRCSNEEIKNHQNDFKPIAPKGPNRPVLIAPKNCNNIQQARPIFVKTVNLKFPVNKTDNQCVNSTVTSLSQEIVIQPAQQIFQSVQQMIQPVQQTIQTVQQIVQPVSEIFPSIQQQIAPSIQQQIVPSIQQQIAPSIQQQIAPSIQQQIAPSIQQQIAPSIQQQMAPSIQQQIIPSSPIVPDNCKNDTEGFSLSPYLKFDRPPQDPSCILQFEIPNDTNNDNEASTSMIHSDSIIKRTPRTLLKSRANNHRLSLSTPRKRISHIRALDFNTPIKGIKSNRRMSDANNSQRLTGKKLLLKTNSRTSLFKSPNKTLSIKKIKTPKRLNTLIDHNNSNSNNDNNNNSNNRVPIATRGPEPKLNGGWDKYTGVGMIIDGLSSQSSSSPEKKPTPTKKAWDADLRGKINIITNVKKPAVRKKRIAKIKKDKNDKLNNIEKKDIEIDNDDSNNSNESDAIKPVDTTANTSIENNVKLNNQNTKSITKKYATLKTLTTSVTKKEISKSLNTSIDLVNKGSGAFSKVNPGFIQNLSELETPRKFDNSNGIPPTPRITSPHSNQTIFSQLNDDSGKIQTFPPTPEFPPTPNIVITPRQSSDITIDTTKDCQFVGCSTYYQPSCELNDDKLVKIKNDNITIEKISTSTTTTTTTTTKISGITDVKSSTYKNDVTQYEVIKGHLPREDKSTELKMSSNDIDKINKDSNMINNRETSNITSNNDSKSLCKSFETSGTADDSSDSDSGSSSSSSSSSGSSSFSSMNDTNTSSRISSGKKIKKSTSNKDKFKELFGDQESDISGIAKDSPIITSTNKIDIDNNKNTKKENESSPTKVFSIIKTDDMLKDIDLETPAKDETILNEEDIGVTPNSSKPGVKNLTNLSSTIAATNNTNNMSPPSVAINKNQSSKIIKPTIVSVKKILPENAVQLKPISQYLNNIPPVQNSANTRDSAKDAKLSAELEEKRLRTINKLNAGTTKQPPKKLTKKNTLPLNNDNKIQQQQQQQNDNDIKKIQEPFTVNKIEKKTRVSRVPAKQIVQTNKIDDTTASTADKIIDQSSSSSSSSSPPVKPVPALIGLRKSARNAEKIAAKRGVSEPRERSGNAKKQMHERKAQSTRESNVNDDIIIDNDILTTNNIVNNLQEINKPVDNANKQDEIKEDNKLIIDSIKEPVKSKVDMVKRDLFSDDEQQNDKVTTRSKTKNISQSKM